MSIDHSPSGKSERTNSKRGTASIGGVGAGTGLIAIAQAIQSSNETLALILTYAAPAASWVAGVAFYVLQQQATRWYYRRVVESAKRTLLRQLENPHTSLEHKTRLRELLEEVETTEAVAEIDRIKQAVAISITTIEAPSVERVARTQTGS